MHTSTSTSRKEIPAVVPASPMSRPSFVTVRDGTQLYYKDWGPMHGRPVVFVSSWTLNSDMGQYQMIPLAAHGFRCIAYDRRGHGRSDQPSGGYDADTLADDLAAVLDALDVEGATLVGHSMAAGEIARFLSRHGDARVARVALLAPTTPFLLQTDDNPDGIPQAGFEMLRALWLQDFPGWMSDNARGFVVENTSDAMIRWVIALMLQCSLKAAIECNVAMAETDFRPEVGAIRVPTLIIHGDKDLSAPLPLTGQKTAALIPHAKLTVYEGAPHGLFITHAERLLGDLLAFIAA